VLGEKARRDCIPAERGYPLCHRRAARHACVRGQRGLPAGYCALLQTCASHPAGAGRGAGRCWARGASESHGAGSPSAPSPLISRGLLAPAAMRKRPRKNPSLRHLAASHAHAEARSWT
jgi:hypothetical protein